MASLDAADVMISLSSVSAQLAMTPEIDDQLLFHDILLALAGRNDRPPKLTMLLDTGCQLFQNGHKTNLEDGNRYFVYDSAGPYYDLKTNRVLNTETNTVPPIIHFNGGKEAFGSLELKLTQSRLVKRNNTVHNSTSLQTAYLEYVREYPDFVACRPYFSDVNKAVRWKWWL
jgi:hypothetical protein